MYLNVYSLNIMAKLQGYKSLLSCVYPATPVCPSSLRIAPLLLWNTWHMSASSHALTCFNDAERKMTWRKSKTEFDHRKYTTSVVFPGRLNTAAELCHSLSHHRNQCETRHFFEECKEQQTQSQKYSPASRLASVGSAARVVFCFVYNSQMVC